MSVRAYLFWGVGICLSGWLLFACSGAKTAASLLEKQKFALAQEKLDKAVEKDSLPVDVYYVYSLLYTDSLFSGYDIDTAYHYVQQATNWYPQLTEKQRAKLYQRLLIDTTRLQRQKLRIDSLAYARANEQPSIQSYQRFLDNFPSAPQQLQATANRNRLVYDSIQQVDTYPGYKYFMDTYPDAEQYPLARQRYNTLAFQELTQKGDLRSYLSFLKDYPNSPYRPQAERAIFEISTAGNHLESYAAFARKYPSSASARQAVNTLFHLYKSRYVPHNFLQDFPNLPYADSLRTSILLESSMRAPLPSDGHYGFVDEQGKSVIDARYDRLPETYFCEGVQADFIHAGSLEENQLLHWVLTKSGVPIFSFTQSADSSDLRIDEAVVDRGAGLLEVVAGDRRSLRHKAGHVIIPEQEQVEEVELLPSDDQADETWPVPYQFIKYRVGEQWGIKSFSGRTLLTPAYEAIEAYGSFLVLERDGLLAITNRRTVLEQMGSTFSPDFSYDDVALLEGQYLVAYQGEKETVLDERLQAVVPLDNHSVVRRFGDDAPATNHWLVKQTDTIQRVVNDSLVTQPQVSYLLLPPTDPAHDSARWQKAFYNGQWLALQSQEKFLLTDYRGANNTTKAYDSVQILSERFVLAFEASDTGQDSVTVLSDHGIQRSFARQTPARTRPTFRLLRSGGGVASKHLNEYLLVDPISNFPLILNPRGEVIFEGKLTGATAYPHGLLAIQQGRYQRLIDSTGQELLPPRYDGIGNYQAPGSLSLFKGKKFGLYQYPTGTLIEPVYESALTSYHTADSAAQSLFVAKENGKYGIVTATNQRMSPFAFERVVYWNDTSALVKADGQWMIYRLTDQITNWSSLNEEHILYGGIEDFSFFQMGGTPLVMPDRDGTPLVMPDGNRNDTLQNENEQLLRIYANNSYGVLSNRRGEVLSPTYDGISLFGDATTDNYLYFTEKYVPEAELYIMIYLNATGQLVKRLALTPDQYDRVYCDGY